MPVGRVSVVVPARASVTAEPTSPLAEPIELCQLWNSSDLSLGGVLAWLRESWSKVAKKQVNQGRLKKMVARHVRWGSTAIGHQHSSCCRHSACQWCFSLECQDPTIASEASGSEHLSSALFLACHMTLRKSPWFSYSFSPSCF